jgi:hypothetical protein
MTESRPDNTLPKAGAIEKESNGRLTLSRTEVNLDFLGLVPQLESGSQIIWVTDKAMGKDLNPEVLRRLGGTAMLGSYFGAAIIFMNQNKTVGAGGPDLGRSLPSTN